MPSQEQLLCSLHCYNIRPIIAKICTAYQPVIQCLCTLSLCSALEQCTGWHQRFWSKVVAQKRQISSGKQTSDNCPTLVLHPMKWDHYSHCQLGIILSLLQGKHDLCHELRLVGLLAMHATNRIYPVACRRSYLQCPEKSHLSMSRMEMEECSCSERHLCFLGRLWRVYILARMHDRSGLSKESFV